MVECAPLEFPAWRMYIRALNDLMLFCPVRVLVHVLHMDCGVEFLASSSHAIPPSGTLLDEDELDSNILDCVIRIQALCDQHRASISFQDDLMRILFEGLGSNARNKAMASAQPKCLASLLVGKPNDWNGRLGEKKIPFNFSQLLHMYKEQVEGV